MKKFGFLVLFMVFLLCTFLVTSCVSTQEVSGEVIIAGSADDPFRNTAWDTKGVTLLEFGSDGKVAFGYNEVSYTIKMVGESYIATFNPLREMTFTIESRDAIEGINDQGTLKIKCTKH